MKKDLDFSYRNENGRPVRGAAALLHHIYTEKGGIQNYNDEIGQAYIQSFIKAHRDEINKNISRQVTKNRFKKIG